MGEDPPTGRLELSRMLVDNSICVRVAELMHYQASYAFGKKHWYPVVVGLPDAHDAVQGFLAIRNAATRAVACSTVEKRWHDDIARRGPLPEELSGPFQVGMACQKRSEPSLSRRGTGARVP